MKTLLFVVAGSLLAVVALTAWALESSGVATVTTRGPEGSRETHVWFVEDAGQLLVEAGTPENPWFVDLASEATLRFDSGERRGEFVATPLPNPEGHERIRRLLRAKYGVRDRWIAFLFDTERSVAVALAPADAGDAALY